MRDFLYMGGYAVYVWSAYALMALLLIVLWAASLTRFRRVYRRIAALAAASTGGTLDGPRDPGGATPQ
ncbi:MAG: heme exporter protein CcmD [Gammaproteobacteria bacterium]